MRIVRHFFHQFKRDPFVFCSVMILFVLLGIFIVYPIAMTFKLSLTKAGAWTLDSYTAIFTKSYLQRSLFNSVTLGCITATFSTIVGFVFAFLLTRTQVTGKRFLRFMAMLPIISPPFMLTLSLILLFGKNGFVSNYIIHSDYFNIYGLWGLVVVQTCAMFPLAYLALSGVLQGIDNATEDAALDLGASRLRTFLDITLPLSIPGIISAWLLVFVGSLADFANPMILAGKFDVLSVQAYLQFTGMGNLELGAALSNFLLVPCFSAYFLQKYYLKKKSFVTVTGKPLRRDRDLTTPLVRGLLNSFALLVSAFILLLYFTVLAGCFTKAWGIDYSFSLDNFRYVFDVGWKTIMDTVILSAISTPIAGGLGLLIAFLIVRKRFLGRRFLDVIAMIPFALPGTAVGIGYVLAFNQEPLLLTGTATIIVLSFVFRNMPVGIESAKASLMQIDKAIEEAATNLGANTAQVFKQITLPLIKPASFASMAYVFVHCMTAVSAVIFLVSARWNHMTVLILAQTEILRFSAAAVLCLILISVVLTAFWLIRKLVGIDALNKGAPSQ
jgi:iron(III) transport system permease protein